MFHKFLLDFENLMLQRNHVSQEPGDSIPRREYLMDPLTSSNLMSSPAHSCMKQDIWLNDMNNSSLGLCFNKVIKENPGPDVVVRLHRALKPWIMTNITNPLQNIITTTNFSVLAQVLLVISLCSFVVFLYIMAVMLCVYFTNSSAREQVRYVLFAHMLINDLIYLLSSLFLFLTSFFPVTFPVPFCYIVITVSSTALKVTPYNLAVMSFERYIAICYPLRHGEICTMQRTNITVGVIWAIGLIPNFVDFIILCFFVDHSFFLLHLKCVRNYFRVTPAQNTIRDVIYISTFSLVGLIILFTYIRIMMVALKISSSKASAIKAGKTVMLHALQLLLCMTAFSYTLVEILVKDYVSLLPVINFFFFMCLPRLISPFIYGIKDELFRKHMKRFVFCKSQTLDSI
ncbi:odorant receptor 131-2-like [Engystomops pustulosus]|uniref:odorant receptor 131-2-like n=1 Tax=Engystomops pustulosus TaxID=76066 RepID=UPI003AFA192C